MLEAVDRFVCRELQMVLEAMPWRLILDVNSQIQDLCSLHAVSY
jgi:hypothetical protein